MPTDAFDIDVVPDDGGYLTPDEEIAALEDLLDPTDADVVTGATGAEPYGRSWNLNGDVTQFVYGVESVKVWAETVLHIERYSFPIIHEDVGVEDLADIVGKADSPELRGLSERDVAEALLTHDRVTNVGDFLWRADDEVLYMSATLEIDGNEEVRLVDVPIGLEAD